MNNAILPDNLEINYRNNHYKHAQDVLNSIIWCSICNSDLKQNIIMNKKIMLHKKFLCLCCKNCFEQLSDSKNGCILCSLKTKLKTCKICNNNMCKRCVDHYYINPKRLKKLKHCLGCSSSVLWSLRSQAAAVLKCFSLELGTRLLLNGEESINTQHLREFVINSAICNENFTQEDINQIRVFNLSYLLNSKIGALLNGYQKLQTKNIEQHLISFSELCEKILVNTCSLLSDSQYLFNDKIIESLNNTIKSLLINGILFKTTENDSNIFSKDSHNTDNLDEHATNKLQQTCSVLLEKLDTNIENQYFLKKEYNESISKHTYKGLFNFKNELVETRSNQQKNNLNPTCPINSNYVSQISLKDLKQCTVQLVRFDEQIIKHHVGQTSKDKIDSQVVNHECNTKDTTINLSNNRICWSPVVKLKRFDVDINNYVKKKSTNKSDSKSVNNNIEHNPEIYTGKKIKLSSEEKNLEIVNPKECIKLETLDMDIIENVNHNKWTTKANTGNKTKTKMGFIKKNSTLQNTKKNKRTKFKNIEN